MDSTTLFTYEPHVDSRLLHGRVLLVTLGAFSDAGQAQALIDDHLLNSMPSRVVGRLDMDQVYDYTGRRPEVTLELDHFEDYERPQILLHEITHPDGSTFFLLSGPEPSFQWERVAGALRIVVEQLGIERTIIMQGFPSPVPHTRELPVTRYAGRSDDIRVRRTMPGVFRMRAPFTALLTLRLSQAGHDVVGVAAHIPQYLNDITFPDGALALLAAVHEEDGPSIDVDALQQRAVEVRAFIDQQVGASQQLQEMVEALEAQHDRMITAGATQEVPTADAIAAEVEQYLAGLGEDRAPKDDDDQDSQGGMGPRL